MPATALDGDPERRRRREEGARCDIDRAKGYVCTDVQAQSDIDMR